jgi:hypothetical protein
MNSALIAHINHPNKSDIVRCATILAVAYLLNACEWVGQPTSDVTLSWQRPTKNTDGSPIKDLSGYYIYYGDSPTALMHVVQLPNPASTDYIVRDLTAGTHFFSVAAYTASGAQSGLSAPASKTIP